jgi:hypothetical protein
MIYPVYFTKKDWNYKTNFTILWYVLEVMVLADRLIGQQWILLQFLDKYLIYAKIK